MTADARAAAIALLDALREAEAEPDEVACRMRRLRAINDLGEWFAAHGARVLALARYGGAMREYEHAADARARIHAEYGCEDFDKKGTARLRQHDKEVEAAWNELVAARRAAGAEEEGRDDG